MNEKLIQSLAEELYKATESGQALEHLTKRHPEMTIEDAYKVSMAGKAIREAKGETIVGAKIGLTSKAMQGIFKLYEPDYGYLSSSMMIEEDQEISLSTLGSPMVETEIAFKLKADLEGPSVTVDQVLAATEGVMASFELIDTRYESWDINILDSIADIASAGKVVLGQKMVPVEGLDLPNLEVILEKNGVDIDGATGQAVLGNPAEAVAWLANKLMSFGTSLRAGDIIISGSLMEAYPVEVGDVFTAKFDELGSISITFKE